MIALYRTDAYRYIHRDDRMYVAERATNLVRSIISQFD